MIPFTGIHCPPFDIPCFPLRGRGGGDNALLVSRHQLCLPKKLIFCRGNQLGQSSFPSYISPKYLFLTCFHASELCIPPVSFGGWGKNFQSMFFGADSMLDGSFHEDNGRTPVHVIENSPHLPDIGRPVPATAQNGKSDSKSLRAVLQVSAPGPSGTLPPHILYLLELGFDIEQIKVIAGKYPPFANYSLEGNIRPLIKFMVDLGVSKSDLPKILIRRPQLCGMTLPENLIPSMAFLETLGVDKSKWPKVISRWPVLLTTRPKKIEATVEFLYEMGVSKENIGKILTRFPQITSSSVEDKLRPIAEYFQSLGADVKVLLRDSPEVMNLSLETNLKPFTQFLLEKGFSKEEVGTMVSKFGSLYKYSLKRNVVPTWEFFLTTDYQRQHLIQFPHYFSYSLEERIKPRYKLMKKSGVKMTLSQLLSRDHHTFELSIRKKIEKLQSSCN